MFFGPFVVPFINDASCESRMIILSTNLIRMDSFSLLFILLFYMDIDIIYNDDLHILYKKKVI